MIRSDYVRGIGCILFRHVAADAVIARLNSRRFRFRARLGAVASLAFGAKPLYAIGCLRERVWIVTRSAPQAAARVAETGFARGLPHGSLPA